MERTREKIVAVTVKPYCVVYHEGVGYQPGQVLEVLPLQRPRVNFRHYPTGWRQEGPPLADLVAHQGPSPRRYGQVTPSPRAPVAL
jgi:hypothetical protein